MQEKINQEQKTPKQNKKTLISTEFSNKQSFFPLIIKETNNLEKDK